MSFPPNEASIEIAVSERPVTATKKSVILTGAKRSGEIAAFAYPVTAFSRFRLK